MIKTKNDKLWEKVEGVEGNLIIGQNFGNRYYKTDKFQPNLITNSFWADNQSQTKYFYVPNKLGKIKGTRFHPDIAYLGYYDWMLRIEQGNLCLKKVNFGQSGDSYFKAQKVKKKQYLQAPLVTSELPQKLKSEVIKDKL